MKSFNPKIILPIIAIVIMGVQKTTGLEFSQADLQIINDAILSIIALAGIFINPKKADIQDVNIKQEDAAPQQEVVVPQAQVENADIKKDAP